MPRLPDQQVGERLQFQRGRVGEGRAEAVDALGERRGGGFDPAVGLEDEGGPGRQPGPGGGGRRRAGGPVRVAGRGAGAWWRAAGVRRDTRAHVLLRTPPPGARQTGDGAGPSG
ncbi:hypothetical protein GCM10009759_60260 [Kitasatospora saccharophila]|uniref:Uncharacterized protein n=1 Tax=Kitasatospora saccharophila TaxID=407973 RepID=A0ABP5JBB9_9ACTN